jgi:hypothetical protein
VHRQREDAPTQYVHCCEQHKGSGEVAAALMQHHLAPAALYHRSLHGGAARAYST